MIDRNNGTGFGIANESMLLLSKRSTLIAALKKPSASDISGFKNALSENTQNPREVSVSGTGTDNQTNNQSANSSIEQLLMLILALLAKLNESISKAGKGDSGSQSAGDSMGGQSTGSTNKKITENSPAGRGNIPKPVEHMHSFNLGGKSITIGGDGSASPAEVQNTKDTIMNLYQNSPTFKSMLDSSPNDSFEISVGRNSDNMSWGNSDGRIFMNVNNVAPSNSDTFQALTAHEFAHAAVNQQHGSEMQRFEDTAAREA